MERIYAPIVLKYEDYRLILKALSAEAAATDYQPNKEHCYKLIGQIEDFIEKFYIPE